MELSVEQASQRPDVTVVRLQGDLDGSNYRELIAKARELHQAGSRHLLLDLTGLRYMSSAGIVALHSTALLYRGIEAPDPEEAGWRAIRAVGESAGDAQNHVKLLNPAPRVVGVLERSGMATFFEVHTDEAAAVASF
jgi:anti-anti-sigma regulatory factor